MKNIYIIWTEGNSVGVPILDEQHKGIVSTINTLHYFLNQGSERQILKQTLAILENYTAIHFLTEEALMEEGSYPGISSHKLLHKQLLKKTREISERSTYVDDPLGVLKFLKQWWMSHINAEDKKYMPYLEALST